MVVSALAGVASIRLLLRRRYGWARITGALAVTAVLWGWAARSTVHPAPSVTITQAAAGHATQTTMLVSLLIGRCCSCLRWRSCILVPAQPPHHLTRPPGVRRACGTPRRVGVPRNPPAARPALRDHIAYPVPVQRHPIPCGQSGEQRPAVRRPADHLVVSGPGTRAAPSQTSGRHRTVALSPWTSRTTPVRMRHRSSTDTATGVRRRAASRPTGIPRTPGSCAAQRPAVRLRPVPPTWPVNRSRSTPPDRPGPPGRAARCRPSTPRPPPRPADRRRPPTGDVLQDSSTRPRTAGPGARSPAASARSSAGAPSGPQ
jgi:hypothetical protein